MHGTYVYTLKLKKNYINLHQNLSYEHGSAALPLSKC